MNIPKERKIESIRQRLSRKDFTIEEGFQFTRNNKSRIVVAFIGRRQRETWLIKKRVKQQAGSIGILV
uniref:Ribonuclease P n=1 Tax=Caenorhabditis tropicalis TaxID=1561998 RepID=A0A1I7U1N9_9PELO